MAIQGAQVDVSTTAVALNAADSDGIGGQTLYVRHMDSDDIDVSLGPATVDPSGAAAVKGYRIQQNETLGPIRLEVGEVLYARAPSGTVTLDVLRLGA